MILFITVAAYEGTEILVMVKWPVVRYTFSTRKFFEKSVSCDAEVYLNIQVLLKIGCTLPVSSCEAERSFSGYRRVKSYIRSSMTTERLAGLTLMHLHNDIEIDVDLICQQYISKYNRRMFKSCILFE